MKISFLRGGHSDMRRLQHGVWLPLELQNTVDRCVCLVFAQYLGLPVTCVSTAYGFMK